MSLSSRLHLKDVWGLQALHYRVDRSALHSQHLWTEEGVPSRRCPDWKYWRHRRSSQSSAHGQEAQHRQMACPCLRRAVHPYRPDQSIWSRDARDIHFCHAGGSERKPLQRLPVDNEQPRLVRHTKPSLLRKCTSSVTRQRQWSEEVSDLSTNSYPRTWHPTSLHQ